MIYQFKVTLKDLKPPIWRRIQVESHFTFHDLHDILQIAFDWLDYHLHEFEVRKTNGATPKPKMIIAPPSDEDDLYFFEHVRLDEHEVTLEEIFRKEKDRCIYTYDFGDDWEHEIVLEKILPPEKGVTYPRCIKVMRRAPEEDSRWKVIEFGVDQTGFDPEEAMLEINTLLADLEYGGEWDEEEDEVHELLSRLFDLAEEFYHLKPWRWMHDHQLFAVRDPDSGEVAYCSVMGAGGESYGLSAFIGQDGLRHLERIFSGQIDPFNSLEMRALTLDYRTQDEITEIDADLFANSCFPNQRQMLCPVFRSYRPGYVPIFPDLEEIEFLITIIELAITVSLMAQEDDSFLNDVDAIYTWMMDENGEWHGELQEHHITFGEVSLLVDEITLQRVKRKLQPSPVAIEYDVFLVPTPVQEHPENIPYFPYLTVALETDEGEVLFYEMDEERDFAKVAQQHFVHFLEQFPYLPRAVYVREEVYVSLEKIAEKLKVDLVIKEELPFITRFKFALQNSDSE